MTDMSALDNLVNATGIPLAIEKLSRSIEILIQCM